MKLNSPRSSVPSSTRRRPASSLVALVALGAVLLVGCSGGPGTKEDFIDVLQREDTFDEAQATCIADGVFTTYGDNGDAIDLLSGAGSWEAIADSQIPGLEGFSDFYADLVDRCTSVGPSVDTGDTTTTETGGATTEADTSTTAAGDS